MARVLRLLLFSIGKFLYGIPFIIFGIMHVMHQINFTDLAINIIEIKPVYVTATGIALIVCGGCILFGLYKRTAALLLALILLAFIIATHGPLLVKGVTINILGFWKDLALFAAALMLAGKE